MSEERDITKGLIAMLTSENLSATQKNLVTEAIDEITSPRSRGGEPELDEEQRRVALALVEGPLEDAVRDTISMLGEVECSTNDAIDRLAEGMREYEAVARPPASEPSKVTDGFGNEGYVIMSAGPDSNTVTMSPTTEPEATPERKDSAYWRAQPEATRPVGEEADPKGLADIVRHTFGRLVVQRHFWADEDGNRVEAHEVLDYLNRLLPPEKGEGE